MENLISKVSYLKGLAEGLNVDKNSAEGKLLLSIIDVLSDIASEVDDLSDFCDELDEKVESPGSYELIGAFNKTGNNQTLIKSYSDYHFIYIVGSYYAGNLPTYGSFFAPMGLVASGFELLNFWTTNGIVTFKFHDDNKMDIGSLGNNNYVVVFGVY